MFSYGMFSHGSHPFGNPTLASIEAVPHLSMI
jgi:hypothetical protein